MDTSKNCYDFFNWTIGLDIIIETLCLITCRVNTIRNLSKIDVAIQFIYRSGHYCKLNAMSL